jgi:acyl carrier protein
MESIEQVRSQLKEFIRSNFLLGKDNASMKDSDSFIDTGIVDSTGVLEIVEFLQEKFAVKVSDDELIPENLDSVDCLVAFVGRKWKP